MTLRRERLAAWIAAFAVALNALWPLIAQAQPKSTRLVTTICSSGGDVHTVDLSGNLPSNGSGTTHDHCKLCVAGGDRFQILQEKSDFPVRAASPSTGIFAPILAADFRSTSNSPARPRAPPAIL